MIDFFFVYALALSTLLLIFLLTSASNLIFFPRVAAAKKPMAPVDSRSISILIPARNEAAIIGQTLERLSQQRHANFECLILDDHSSDQTADIVLEIAARDPRFKLVSGRPLPPGWGGKNWACHQLSELAKGEILLFCDSDVQFAPSGLFHLLAQFQQTEGDLVTVWPTQQTVTWVEKLVVPLMKFAILSYLPIIGVHYTPLSAFAAANGQCLLFKRDLYHKIGGHAAVKADIVEDVRLAQLTKQHGGRLRMLDGNHQISCRMYTDWESTRHGFGKNIVAGHGNSLPFLAVSTLFHWSLFLLPWFWLLTSLFWGTPGFGITLFLIIGTFALRLMTELFVRAPQPEGIMISLLMPVSVILMTRIAWQGVRWHLGDGPQWKGRTFGQSGQQDIEVSNG